MEEEDSILQSFGRNVKRWRLKRNVSQESFAELCNLDRTYVSGIERGKRNVSLINIHRLAEGLGISPSELLEEMEDCDA